MSRRDALKVVGASGALAAAGLPVFGCATSKGHSGLDAAKNLLVTPDGRDFNPVDRTLPHLAPRLFAGENPEKGHRVLWDVKAAVAAGGGKIPEPTERVPVVIVGGGLGGLFSAYFLRQHQPVVLEAQARLGGNCRAESWHGIDYAIGAAYFMEPAHGSPLGKIYAEIGIDKLWRVKGDEDPVLFEGKVHKAFWDGETDPARAPEIKRLHRYFLDVLNENGQVFPDIPILDPNKRAYIDSIDKVSFRAHLEKVLGGPLHPHAEKILSLYMWSTFACTFDEASAAAGLNAYASEFGEVFVTPGGNAAVAENLLCHLMRTIPPANIRPSCLAFDVAVKDDGVVVAYEDQNQQLCSIHAQVVVMACPKFIAGRILEDIEPERAAAIKRLRYNSYLVGNVLLDGPVEADVYDVFLLGDGHVDLKDIQKATDRQRSADAIFATFARPDKERTVLSLYRGMPYPEARTAVYGDDSFDTYRRDFENQLISESLPGLGIDPKRIVDVRLARFGHPMPVPAIGMIAEGVCDTIRKPFRERVFFVEQDNWAYAALETSAIEAVTYCAEVEKRLRA
ncbi:MAG: NAD(P)-binding protein [Deltaproteobacteria bacterium]|nr:NAD(P)-binding protein [Deltaproteobacteria bacterium]